MEFFACFIQKFIEGLRRGVDKGALAMKIEKFRFVKLFCWVAGITFQIRFQALRPLSLFIFQIHPKIF